MAAIFYREVFLLGVFLFVVYLGGRLAAQPLRREWLDWQARLARAKATLAAEIDKQNTDIDELAKLREVVSVVESLKPRVPWYKRPWVGW